MKQFLFISSLAIFAVACNPKQDTNTTTTETIVTTDTNTAVKPADTSTAATTATTNPDPAHNAQNSVDWAGTYTGTLPCASCEGIETTIVLKDDNSYTITENYKGEKDGKFNGSGKFTWDSNGTIITLKGKDENRKYFVAEGKIMQVGEDGKVVEGPLAASYELIKK